MKTTTTAYNRPVRFAGTKDEARANYNSHAWLWSDDGDNRCMNCDSRPSGVHAEYPCGDEAPREWVEVSL